VGLQPKLQDAHAPKVALNPLKRKLLEQRLPPAAAAAGGTPAGGEQPQSHLPSQQQQQEGSGAGPSAKRQGVEPAGHAQLTAPTSPRKQLRQQAAAATPAAES
jgi:hypothetical protein